MLVEYPFEGGDAACESFASLVLCKWLGYHDYLNGGKLEHEYDHTKKQLINLPSGLWRRHSAKSCLHWKEDYWASHFDTATRDNGTSACIAAIVFADTEYTKAIFNGFVRRKWFCGNTHKRNTGHREEPHTKYAASWRQPFDPTPTFPDYGGILKSILYRSPLKEEPTWFWDIFCCLIPAILIWKDVGDGNHLNAFMRIEFCNRVRPTFISRLARKILPKDIGLKKEFGPDTKNPPMYLLTRGLGQT